MIDLRPMKGMRVDPTRRTARAEPGLTWGEFDRETQAFGLATTGGLVSTTGIAGFTLGGGLGWLMRGYGLACDNLLSVDVVTADGRFITASAAENDDLFWGVRGGGGNFGVVTSFEYRLHPVAPVLAGMTLYPLERARDVLRFYRAYALAAPDELTVHASLLTAPDVGPAVAMLLCYNGPIAEGEEAVHPLRAFGAPLLDTVRPVPYAEFQRAFDAGSPPGLRNYWQSSFLKGLDDAAIAAVVDCFATAPSARSNVLIERLGGAMSRVGDGETAFARRDADFDILISAVWDDPAEDEQNIAWARVFRLDGAIRARHGLRELPRRRGRGSRAGGVRRRQVRATRRPEGHVRSGQPVPTQSEHQTHGEITMRYGLNMGPLDVHADPRTLAGLARDAEEAGWDGFFIWDNMVFDPYNGTLDKVDTWVALAAIAMSTQRIRIGPMVAALPRRRPWKVAREAVAIDHLSNGRLILGAGLGDPSEQEFGWFGDEPERKKRAGMLDEALDIIVGLWSGQPFSYDGAYYHLHEMVFRPTPVQSPRIPIWLGGWWPHKAPLRRAARWDGMHPGKEDGPLTPDEVREMMAYIAEHRTSQEPFDLAVPGITPADDPARGAEIVAPFADTGATWWIEDCGPESFRPRVPGQTYVWPVREIEERIRKGPPKVK